MSRLSAWVHAMIRRAKARRASVLLPLVEESFPVVCCWSPKAGCTTVLKWFLKHTGKLEEALRYNAWPHNYRMERLFQQPGYERLCRRAVRSDRFRVIKVIRDPAQRVVSAYLHYLRVAPQGWHGEVMLDNWKAEHGLGSQEGYSFRQFLQFIHDIDDFGSLRDPHLRPQYNYAYDPHVDDIIPLENIAIRLAETERLCGLPHVDIQALSESAHHNHPSSSHRWPSDASSLPATVKTLDELGVPSAALLLDNETIPLVQKIYACDYRAYARHYSPPHRNVAS
jgi:hypothetical protein